MGCRGVRKDWLLLHAWAAPGCPEVDDNGLAPQIAHTDFVPVELLDGKVRRGMPEQVRSRQRRVLQAPSERHHEGDSENKGPGRDQTGPDVQRAAFMVSQGPRPLPRCGRRDGRWA